MAGEKEQGLEESLEKQIEDIDRKRREVNTRLKELGGTRGGRGAAERSFTERPRDSRCATALPDRSMLTASLY